MKLKYSILALAMGVSTQALADIPFVDVRPERITTEEASRTQGTPAAEPQRQGTPVGGNLDALRQQAMALNYDDYYTDDINLQEFGFPADYEPIPASQGRLPRFVQDAIDNYKPEQQVDLKPMQNKVIAVGFGLMNSIPTSFTSLAVKTSDEFSILEVEDGFLYVTPLTDQPISLILYEDGVQESQVSLVLYPIDAPPTVARVNVELTPEMRRKAAAHRERLAQEAERQESERRMREAEGRQSPPSAHVAYLTNLLKQVAQERMPSGFNMTNDIPPSLLKPCQVTIRQHAGQRMSGTREVIDVVLIENDSDRIYHIREEMCLTRDAMAVAIHDKAYLRPGDSTEVYIIRDRHYQQERAREITRPRLTSNGG